MIMMVLGRLLMANQNEKYRVKYQLVNTRFLYYNQGDFGNGYIV
jgi:hypothetical protein